MFLGSSSASLPVGVPVFYLNHPADRVLTLGCPGARPNMAVAWDRGSEPIYRYECSAGSNIGATPRRLLIDTGHHLVFKPAKSQDSGTKLHESVNCLEKDLCLSIFINYAVAVGLTYSCHVCLPRFVEVKLHPSAIKQRLCSCLRDNSPLPVF